MTVLFERHSAHVRAYLLRLAPGQGALVDDCVQEAFVAAFHHASSFRTGSARPWLIRIAARRLTDHRRAEARRRRREVQHFEEGGDRSPGGRKEDGLEALLARLAPRDRAVLELRFVQQLTHAEVAETLGVSPRTAKAWAQGALGRLRELESGGRSDD